MRTLYSMSKVHVPSFHEAVQYPHEAIKGVRVSLSVPNTYYYLNNECPEEIQDMVQLYLITRSPSRVLPTIYYVHQYLEREYA